MDDVIEVMYEVLVKKIKKLKTEKLTINEWREIRDTNYINFIVMDRGREGLVKIIEQNKAIDKKVKEQIIKSIMNDTDLMDVEEDMLETRKQLGLKGKYPNILNQNK